MKKSIAILTSFFILAVASTFASKPTSAGGGNGISSSSTTVGSVPVLNTFSTQYYCTGIATSYDIDHAIFQADALDGQTHPIDISQSSVYVKIDGVSVPGTLSSVSSNSFVWTPTQRPYHVDFHTDYSNSGEIQINTAHILTAGRVGFQAKFVQADGLDCFGSGPAYGQTWIINYTPAVLPTPNPAVGFVQPAPLDVTLTQNAQNMNVFTLRSTTATSFNFYGYPTTWGAGINWLTMSGGIAQGGTTTIGMSTVNIPLGTYTGTARLQDNTYNGEMQFPVTVHVVAALPSPTPTPTAIPTPTPTPAPIAFSNINVTAISRISGTVNWTTNPAGTTKVLYGTTTAVTSSTAENQTLTTSHSVILNGLARNTLYYYRVVSKDAQGREYQSAIYSFKTNK